ncbi:MAG: hypothetical protein GHCLOJNM_04217 [bacterium]|nr:hypothetical protein [bacterium]
MALSPHSRRDFLNPKTLGRLAATLTGGELAPPQSEGAGEGWLYKFRREAMATRFEILIEVIDADLAPVARAGLDRIDRLEAQLTVYRDTSEVCGLNRSAFEGEVAVEAELFELLGLSRALWEETEGCFDVAVHPLLVAWGVFKGPRRTPSPEEIAAALEVSGMDKVVLNPERRSVRFSRPGVGINFGAIGKGYALDRVAEEVRAGGLEHFLLHGGHSSVLARGSSTWEAGWLVTVVDPTNWDRPIAKVRLSNEALSTSSERLETLLAGETSHVLDPRTGRPLEGDLLSVTVKTPSAARAEGLSTAFLVMGLDKTLEYCKKHPDVGVLAVRRSPQTDGIEMVHAGIPEHSLEALL